MENKLLSMFNFVLNFRILKNELKEWREKLAILLLPEKQEECHSTNVEPDSASDVSSYPASTWSPPQPADPDCSIIDQLVKYYVFFNTSR